MATLASVPLATETETRPSGSTPVLPRGGVNVMVASCAVEVCEELAADPGELLGLAEVHAASVPVVAAAIPPISTCRRVTVLRLSASGLLLAHILRSIVVRGGGVKLTRESAGWR